MVGWLEHPSKIGWLASPMQLCLVGWLHKRHPLRLQVVFPSSHGGRLQHPNLLLIHPNICFPEFLCGLCCFLLHPHLVTSSGFEWKPPLDPASWLQITSMKLKALVDIVLHHLEHDGHCPLTVDNDEDSPTLTPIISADERNLDGTSDKIVVFSNFSVSNKAIEDTSLFIYFIFNTL